MFSSLVFCTRHSFVLMIKYKYTKTNKQTQSKSILHCVEHHLLSLSTLLVCFFTCCFLFLSRLICAVLFVFFRYASLTHRKEKTHTNELKMIATFSSLFTAESKIVALRYPRQLGLIRNRSLCLFSNSNRCIWRKITICFRCSASILITDRLTNELYLVSFTRYAHCNDDEYDWIYPNSNDRWSSRSYSIHHRCPCLVFISHCLSAGNGSEIHRCVRRRFTQMFFIRIRP